MKMTYWTILYNFLQIQETYALQRREKEPFSIQKAFVI